MSFRGELREFELPDIMQLIASQRKAGWLKIITKNQVRFVFFRDGKITSTKNPNQEDDPLESYLLRRKILSPPQGERVAAIRRRTGMDVQDIVQKEGLLSSEEIVEFFEAMIEEDVFELMTVKSGTYEFETEQKAAPLPDGALSAEIGPILMETARKADEVAEMRASLGPDDGVLVLTAAGREGEPTLEEEARLLSLVNGTRTIEDVLDESELDRYTGTRILFDIARRGWIGLVMKKGSAATPHEVVEGEFDARAAFRWGAPILALLFFAALLTDVLARFRTDDPFLGELLGRHALLESADRSETVRVALEVFRVRSGRYPETLEPLAEDGLVSTEQLFDRERPLWLYEASKAGDSFALLPRPGEPLDPVSPGKNGTDSGS